VVCAKPRGNVRSKTLRELQHLRRVLIRDRSRALVAADVSPLAKLIELGDERGLRANREPQRLKYPKVMALTGSAIPGRRLKRGVVGYVQAPVRTQVRRLRISEVAVDDAEQLADLLPTGLVLHQPSALEPLLQAHARLRSGTIWGRVRDWSRSDGRPPACV